MDIMKKKAVSSTAVFCQNRHDFYATRKVNKSLLNNATSISDILHWRKERFFSCFSSKIPKLMHLMYERYASKSPHLFTIKTMILFKWESVLGKMIFIFAEREQSLLIYLPDSISEFKTASLFIYFAHDRNKKKFGFQKNTIICHD